MRITILGSGSKGNAYAVQEGGTLLLVDAGFSFRRLRVRMEEQGLDIHDVTALFLSHEHADHMRALAMFAKHHPVPVYTAPGTIGYLRARGILSPPLVPLTEEVEVGELAVRPFPLSHDAADPVGFVLRNPRDRVLGVATDTGVLHHAAMDALQSLDALILECNHDEGMLIDGPYPWEIKQRIRSRVGHLSNQQVREGLPHLLSHHLQRMVLAHLSEENNSPALVRVTLEEVLKRECATHVKMMIAAQHTVTPTWEV